MFDTDEIDYSISVSSCYDAKPKNTVFYHTVVPFKQRMHPTQQVQLSSVRPYLIHQNPLNLCLLCKPRFALIIYVHFAPPIVTKKDMILRKRTSSCSSNMYTSFCLIIYMHLAPQIFVKNKTTKTTHLIKTRSLKWTTPTISTTLSAFRRVTMPNVITEFSIIRLSCSSKVCILHTRCR